MVLVKRLAVANAGAFQGFIDQPEPLNQGVDGGQHRHGHVIGIDLIAGEQQQVRARFGITERVRHHLIRPRQPVRPGLVGLAAGAVQQIGKTRPPYQAGTALAGVQQMRRPVRYRPVAMDDQVVADFPSLGQ